MRSIVTDPKLTEFYRWLRINQEAWPMSAEPVRGQEALAELVMTNRAHLSQVLAGRRRGKHTWRRLVKVIPEPGLLLLQSCPAWNKDAQAAWAERKQREEFGKRFAKYAEGAA